MPLETQIVRNGEPIKLRWGWWHLIQMHKAADAEGKLDELKQTGTTTLNTQHTYIDPADNEVLQFRPGDELREWRVG